MSETHVLEKTKTPHKITLYKNGDNPNIYYYFSWKHKSYRGSTGTDSLDISRNKVIEIFFVITKGLRGRGSSRTIKFEHVLKKFLDYKRDQNLSKTTLDDYKFRSKYLVERFKGRDINSICSKSEYLDYREWRRKYYLTHDTKKQQVYKKNGKTVKGRIFNSVGNVPINRELRLLISLLRFGKEYMGILQNVQIPSYELLPERRREDILDKKEYEKLREYWIKKNPYYWMIISFVNNTGIRYPSELNKIIWKDVNLKKSYVLIRDRKNKNKSEPLNTPVPLIGTSKEIIETLKSRKDIPKGDDDPVFVNDNGVQISNIRKSFKQSIVDCGIKKNLCMYSLRHLYTTRMVKRPDIPLIMISQSLGHKDTSMVNKYYSHLRIEDLVKTFQKSEERKQEILEQEKHTDGN